MITAESLNTLKMALATLDEIAVAVARCESSGNTVQRERSDRRLNHATRLLWDARAAIDTLIYDAETTRRVAMGGES